MVNATDFDGSADFFARGGGLTGAADGQLGILSVWLKPTDFLGFPFSAQSDRVSFDIPAGQPRIILRNSSNAIVLNMFASSVELVTNDWQHILMAWDTSASLLADLYIDDVSITTTISPQIEGTVDYTLTDWTVGARIGGVSHYNGCISELYFNSAEYLDITSQTNRRKFIDASGDPVDLGADGSTPTGTAPIIYLPNAFGSFGTNAGSGGNFTEDGGSSVVACADVPPGGGGVVTGDYILPLMRRRQRRA